MNGKEPREVVEQHQPGPNSLSVRHPSHKDLRGSVASGFGRFPPKGEAFLPRNSRLKPPFFGDFTW
ncbi:hypothetical protein COU74_00995 [Candidatus Peregrinibacteria bacterium CG10_big_fil_rev_8_21_14_0_10_36_19]|nr:MAG: hypothetical protein COU74_00995 [Candidatus Peregrinibacteria bacterium CG10_big_fil_rev_8_21_14_0_10_36_19]